jgi:hypothetical protein
MIGGQNGPDVQPSLRLKGSRRAMAHGYHHMPKSSLTFRVAVEAVAFGLALRPFGFNMTNTSNEINSTFILAYAPRSMIFLTFPFFTPPATPLPARPRERFAP